MKYFRVCLLIVMCAFSVAIFLPTQLVRAQGDCGVIQDASWVEEQLPNSCGTNIWVLEVEHNDGVKDEDGTQSAYGACYPAYLNCSGQQIPKGFVPAGGGGEKMVFDGLGPLDESAYVYWEMDYWTVQLQASCNNGHSNEDNLVQTNYPNETPEFLFWCV